jgi:protein phosphatase
MFKRLDHEHGPFDLIGDIHGCCTELQELLNLLGYHVVETRTELSLNGGPIYAHPENRKCIFLGDLVDRGPRILDTLRLVHNMVTAEVAFCVVGNHDHKLLRQLKGHRVQITHGLAETLAEIEALPDEIRPGFQQDLQQFLETLPHHYILDQGHLVVAHAGLAKELHGKTSDRTRSFALYGETTGQKDEYGLPIRGDWPARYNGQAKIIYGHTPIPEPAWRNRTLNIDTGCVFGGRLTALRYPEEQLISVRAQELYYRSAKPFPRAEPTPA